MNDNGYSILKERWNKPILDDSSGLLKFIQKMYLWRLEQDREMHALIDRYISGMSEKAQGYALVSQHASCFALNGGPTFASMKKFSQPFYEECLELARFVNSHLHMKFSDTPYVQGRGGSVANRNVTLICVNRGDMPILSMDELNRCRQEAYAYVTHGNRNIIHKIEGFSSWHPNGGVESRILMSCCKA